MSEITKEAHRYYELATMEASGQCHLDLCRITILPKVLPDYVMVTFHHDERADNRRHTFHVEVPLDHLDQVMYDAVKQVGPAIAALH